MKMESSAGSDKEEREEAVTEERSAGEKLEDRGERENHEGKSLEDGDHHPPGVVDEDDLMIDINGDDLFFAENTFPSLPDFSSLSSPIIGSPSPSSASICMHAKGGAAAFSSASSSSSSSSSASWSFRQPPPDAAEMQQPEELEEAEPDGDFMMLMDPADHDGGASAGKFSEAALDILNDMELLDLSLSSAGPWDPCSIFPAMDIAPSVEDIAAAATIADQENSAAAIARATEEEDYSSDQDLSKMFLDWLKSNRDSITPEDLRTIKLKRSTIDCAARRLGGGKQAKMQLLRLILTWVQNNHLQKKRRRSRYQSSADHPSGAPPSLSGAFRYHQFHHHQQLHQQMPINPNQFDYSGRDCAYTPSWMPYFYELFTGAAAYGGGGDMVLQPGAAAPGYCYSYNSSSSSTMVMDGQPFSPVDPNVAGAWPPQFAAAAQFAPFPCAMGPLPPYAGLPSQFSGHPAMYAPQAQTFSATKEARKKRMARQRRYSSLRNQKQVNHHPHFSAASFSDLSSWTNPDEAAGSSADTNQHKWVICPNLPDSGCNQMNPIIEPTDSSNTQNAAAPLPPPAPEQKQAQKQNSNCNSSDKRQGWKAETNMKFLLQKVLKQSDVGSLGRIVLPKKEAETHLPELDARDGIAIDMEDIGMNKVWSMRYRYWPNNKSRMYLLENTGDFVRTNDLQEGDFIVLYSDAKCTKYMIRGVKVREPRVSTGGKNIGKLAHGSTKKIKAACSSFQ